MTRPLGYPPTPNAASRASDPVEDVEISRSVFSPNFMTEPLPNCFSICFKACSKAALRSLKNDSSLKRRYFFSSYLYYTPYMRNNQRKNERLFDLFYQKPFLIENE